MSKNSDLAWLKKDGSVVYKLPGLTVWYSNETIANIKKKLNSKACKDSVKLVKTYLNGNKRK